MSRRIRYNFVRATLGAELTSGATTITFAAAPVFATLGSDEVVVLVVGDDPGPYEVVHLTAYTAGNTTGTVLRAQEGTADLTHASGARVLHAPTAPDYGQTVDEQTGHGLGAGFVPPPSSPNLGGVVAGLGATVEDGYSGYVALGRSAAMILGPHDWQDGIAIGDGSRASGEAFAIGTGAKAYNYGSFSITDYPSGLPAAGDIGIGAYVDFGNYDETVLGYGFGPPGNLAVKSTTRVDGSSQFASDTVPYYYVKLVGPNGQSEAPQSLGSQFVQAGRVLDITFNNDTELEGSLANTTEIRLYAQYGSLGGNDEWILVTTLDVSAASYPITITDDGSAQGNDPDPAATSGWVDSETEGSRVLIGYSAFVSSGVQALESVIVGANNSVSHDRCVLIGSSLSSQRDNEVKVGGPNHLFVAPGALELATVTVTSAYTIDASNKQTVVLADTTGGAFDVTLPAPYSGRTLIIKRTDGTANTLNVVTPGAETIDGNASESLPTQYDVLRLVSDGADWFKV